MLAKSFKNYNDNFYLYDTSTNLILNLDKEIYDNIEVFGNYNNENILLNKLNIKFKNINHEENIKSKINDILNYKNKYGLFKPIRFDKILYPISNKEIKKTLNNRLNIFGIDITHNCNFNCKYCMYYNNKQNTSMKLSTLFKSIDFIYEKSKHYSGEKLFVSFYGGEPLLRIDLIKHAVNYAEKIINKKIVYSLTTNGSLLTKENIKFLIKHNFIVLVSIDGPPKIHNRYRVKNGNNPTFSIIEKNLRKIKIFNNEYYDNNIGFSTVLAPPIKLLTIRRFFENWELSTKGAYFISSINQKHVTNSIFARKLKNFHKTKHEDLEILRKEFLDLFVNHKEFEVETKDKFLNDLFMNQIMKIFNRQMFHNQNYILPLGACIPGMDRTFIGINGELNICEKIAYDVNIGNINNGFDFNKIFYLMEKFINLSTDCLECWASRLCGTCYAHLNNHNLLNTSCLFDYEIRKNFCELRKKSLLEKLKLYTSFVERYPDSIQYFRK